LLDFIRGVQIATHDVRQGTLLSDKVARLCCMSDMGLRITGVMYT